MKASEQAEMDRLLAKFADENKREEEARPAPTAEQVAKEAAFLKKWAKGKPIRRQAADATFWAAGKWMTKMDYKMAQALADGGFAKLTGDPKTGGATLVMV